MKNLFKTILLTAITTTAFTACSDWTETEPKNPTDLTTTNRSEAYYAQLRKYKATDHEVSFGWFGNWTGSGASLENSLAGLPDSTDFVSLWGNWKNPTAAQLKDLRYVQEKKGTKALICFLVFDIGDQITPEIPEDKRKAGMTFKQWRHEFWGWKNDEASQLEATKKYANAICDTIYKYNYDGFDIDAEPSYAQPFATDRELWTNPKIMTTFVETLAKRIGPKSGTKKMLVVDGEPHAFLASLGSYFDYFILQAYGNSSNSGLDSRVSSQIGHFKGTLKVEEIAKKIIVCENFERYASSGGVTFRAPHGKTMPSLWGFAQWEPTYDGKTYRKGGVGTFHMEYEYGPKNSITYPYLRKAINIMNPIIK